MTIESSSSSRGVWVRKPAGLVDVCGCGPRGEEEQTDSGPEDGQPRLIRKAGGRVTQRSETYKEEQRVWSSYAPLWFCRPPLHSIHTGLRSDSGARGRRMTT